MKRFYAFSICMLLVLFYTPVNSQTVSTLVPGPSTFDDALILDADGNIYASRYVGTTITKITPAGMTSIFASGFNAPNGTDFGPDGYLYVPSNISNGRINRISPAGVVDTFITSISFPTTILFGNDGKIFIASYQNNRIYLADSTGSYSILYTGNNMNGPVGMKFDSQGNLIIGNYNDGKIFVVDTTGTFSQIADLPGQLGFLEVVNNVIYSTGIQTHRIYRTTLNGDTSTYAGTGSPGQTNGPALTSTFNRPNGIVATPSGDTLYISDFGARSLRVISGVSTGITQVGSVIPDGFNLSQNYPNPFNPSTKINFQIPLFRGVATQGGQGVLTNLSVFNTLGQQVSVLVNEALKPGSYEYTFNASELTSGIYYYKLQAGQFTETKKMLMIK